MIVIYAGWDAVDAALSHALFARDERQLLRTAKSCGPDAPMLAFKLRGSVHAMTVTTKPGHRGEHEISRKTIAQGMPVETGEPVEDYRILCGHGCIGHPAFPASSFLSGRRLFCKPRAHVVARTPRHIYSSSRPPRRDPYAVSSMFVQSACSLVCVSTAAPGAMGPGAEAGTTKESAFRPSLEGTLPP